MQSALRRSEGVWGWGWKEHTRHTLRRAWARWRSEQIAQSSLQTYQSFMLELRAGRCGIHEAHDKKKPAYVMPANSRFGIGDQVSGEDRNYVNCLSLKSYNSRRLVFSRSANDRQKGWVWPVEKSGYRFTYRKGSGYEYSVSARPVQYGRTGTLSYFSDQSGVIRSTSEESG